MKLVTIKLSAGILLGFVAGTVYGNGLRVISQDGFATARGDAFTATADNASAVYYNPAGITQITGTDIRAGLYNIYLAPTFRPPPGSPNAGQTYDIKKHFAEVPQIFIAHTFKDSPVSVGLGIYAPFGGSIQWPDDTNFRAVALKGTATYIRLNPVIAFKLGDYVSIGGGLSANYARMHLEQGLRPQVSLLEDYFRYTGDGWALGGNFGLLVKPCEQLSFGVTMRTKTSFQLEGDTSFEQQIIIGKTQIPAVADFQFPLTATFGVSWRPTPKWNFEFDADYAGWDSFGTVTIHQNNTPPFPLQQNIPVKFGWHDSWNYEIGATRYFDNGWHASAGYVFSENSVPNDFYTPLAADMDRHFISFGVGHTGQRMDFDVTYQFGYGPHHTVSGSKAASSPGAFAGQNADGTYGFLSHAILVSLGLHF